MKQLYGVTVAMITPMDEKGELDLKTLEALTEALIARGVNCLYPCGTTGEMTRLSLRERMQVAETVVRTAAGRVTVFIHIGADTPADTIALGQHAAAIGADGAGVVTPLFLHATDRELEEYYLEVLSQLPEDFPVYLYNIPQCSGNDLSSKSVERICRQAKNVVGIKYSYLDMNRTSEYLDTGKDFSVLHGCDKFFSSLLVMGCKGTVSGVAGVFPEPFVRVYDAYVKGNIQEMQQWQGVCRQICDLLRCGSNMAFFKSGLAFRGIPAGHMRAPQKDLTEREEQALYTALTEFCRENNIPQKIV